MNDEIRVAAYCRVSTDKSDQLNSLTNQRKFFLDYIRRHDGWRLVEIYSDEGISGTSTKKRTNFNRMIQDAESRKIDKILTKEVSRFARNTLDTLVYTRRLREIGISVLFINDNIDTFDEDGEVRLSLMASMAQDESRKTSARVRWGQKRSMENGVVFGRDLLGYTVKDGKLSVNEEEAAVVRLIFHKYLTEEKGTHVIARELQEAGIRPKRAQSWSNKVILRILKNEKYVGDLLQQKTFTPDFLTHKKKYNRGEREMVFLRNHHEPIIDRETWDRAQAKLKQRSKSKEQRTKYSNRYWCSGKIRCGICGSPFVSRTKKRKDGSMYKAWRCSAAAARGAAKKKSWGGTAGCDCPSVNEQTLLACMRFISCHLKIDRAKIADELTKQIRSLQPAETCADVSPLYKRMEDCSRKKVRAIDLALNGTISRDDLKRQMEYYEHQVNTLKEQIHGLEAEIRIREEQTGNPNFGSEIGQILTFEEDCESVYREAAERITVFPNNRIAICLAGIPFTVMLHYSTCGRNEHYSVKIDDITVVSPS